MKTGLFVASLSGLSAVSAAGGSPAAASGGTETLGVPALPVVSQSLVIEGAQPSAIEIAPVFGGKDWAFTARWDDNHANSVNMRDAMQEIGLKGTFYLNASSGKFAGDFARALSEKGNSVGGHTTSHGILPTYNANTLFREILFNRIEREAQTGVSINSFAFPYGIYSEAGDPDSLRRISDALLRSGYHHNVYTNFVLQNPHLPSGFVSTVNQVVPGDRVINAPAFEKAIGAVLTNPDYRRRTPVISLGVHPWQSAEELLKFKDLLRPYTWRGDFWYCNQTELAAYLLQASQSTLSPEAGKLGHYTLSRPDANAAGVAVPLTLRLSGDSKPGRVLLDGRPLTVFSREGKEGWYVNLPYPPSLPAVSIIDWVSNTHGTPSGEGSVRIAEKFPQLAASLAPAAAGGWKLLLRNNGTLPLENINITLRLPALYNEGIRLLSPGTLAAGGALELDLPAGSLSDDPAAADGPLFAAAQIDFLLGGNGGRLYAVYLQETDDAAPVSATTPVSAATRASTSATTTAATTASAAGAAGSVAPASATASISSTSVAGIRDAAAVSGPFAPDGWDGGKLLAFSIPGAVLEPVNDTVLGQWHVADAWQRQTFSRDRFMPLRRDAAWRKAAATFSRKPAVVVVVLDIALAQAAPLKVQSASPVVFAALDGKPLELGSDGQTLAPVATGKHRLLLVIDTEKLYLFNVMRLGRLVLSAGGEPVTVLAAPAIR